MRDQEKNLRIEEISISESFVNKPIKTLSLKKYRNILLLAIRGKEGWVYNPGEDYILKKDDILVIMTTPEEKSELERIFI